MGKTIAIIGAGAKAAAIVARAAVLRDLGGAEIPDLLVFEAEHIGAAWSGRGRFSSGWLSLCTAGEKDVGFPYNEIVRRGSARPAVAPALFARFSWQAYLVATGRMSDWVDRGRNHPTHRSWADYLGWVFETAGQPVIQATVTKARPIDGDQWEISYRRDGQLETAVVDGVVLTGTGQAARARTGGTGPRAGHGESWLLGPDGCVRAAPVHRIKHGYRPHADCMAVYIRICPSCQSGWVSGAPNARFSDAFSLSAAGRRRRIAATGPRARCHKERSDPFGHQRKAA